MKFPKFLELSEDNLKSSAISFALAITLTYLIVAERQFPINDGGFWYSFASQLTANGFRLPKSIVFNGADFQLTYPPLGAYLIAGFHRLFGFSILQALLILPAFFYLINNLLFARFANTLLGNSMWAKATIISYPLLAYSFRWFLMGGGVPRGLGLAFQILAWTACIKSMESDSINKRNVLTIALFTALAILSHPMAALWTVIGVSTFMFAKVNLKHLIGIFICAGIMCSPWLILMVYHHGLTPYLNTFSATQTSVIQLFQIPIYLSYSQLSVGMAFIGLFLVMCTPFWRLSCLWLFGLVIDPRGAALHNGVVPVAFFVGKCASEMIEKLKLQRKGAVLAVLFALTSLSNELITTTQLISSKDSFMTVLGEQEVADIYTFKGRVPEGSKTFVMNQHSVAGDSLGEWLTALTGIEVVNIHQMAEWKGTFYDILTYQAQHISTCCKGALDKCEKIISDNENFLFIVHKKSCPLFESKYTATGAALMSMTRSHWHYWNVIRYSELFIRSKKHRGVGQLKSRLLNPQPDITRQLLVLFIK